jgi:hypothetical protein
MVISAVPISLCEEKSTFQIRKTNSIHVYQLKSPKKTPSVLKEFQHFLQEVLNYFS